MDYILKRNVVASSIDYRYVVCFCVPVLHVCTFRLAAISSTNAAHLPLMAQLWQKGAFRFHCAPISIPVCPPLDNRLDRYYLSCWQAPMYQMAIVMRLYHTAFSRSPGTPPCSNRLSTPLCVADNFFCSIILL